MSTDAVKRIDEAREALRETVDRLAEIAARLRGEPEPEIPSEPAIGSVVLVGVDSDPTAGYVFRRYGLGWCPPGGDDEALTWPEVCSFGAPIPLVRADQTVVLPSEFEDGPAWLMHPSEEGSWLRGWPNGADFVFESFLQGHVGRMAVTFADAERWLLETLALVRSKGGAR